MCGREFAILSTNLVIKYGVYFLHDERDILTPNILLLLVRDQIKSYKSDGCESTDFGVHMMLKQM